MEITLTKKHMRNQKELADLIGVTPDTLSKGKRQKGYMSPEKYMHAATLTGIDFNLWASGSRKRLDKKLKAFFKKQKWGAV